MKVIARRITKAVRSFLRHVLPHIEVIETLREIAIQGEIRRRQDAHPNPFCKFGQFGFSQTDEDGITLEVLRRIPVERGTFCEFGVGDGMENNTLVLLSLGWRGLWVGGQELAFSTPECSRLTFIREWVTQENILALYSRYFKNGLQADVVSLDLDGNDFHFVETLLSAGVTPKLFIVEYNARFPAGVEFHIPYDEGHVWQGDDYFGASISSYNRLFEKFGYKLVCCNAATGANAFFVHGIFADRFMEVPSDIERIYSAPFYFVPRKVGHRKSARTIMSFLN